MDEVAETAQCTKTVAQVLYKSEVYGRSGLTMLSGQLNSTFILEYPCPGLKFLSPSPLCQQTVSLSLYPAQQKIPIEVLQWSKWCWKEPLKSARSAASLPISNNWNNSSTTFYLDKKEKKNFLHHLALSSYKALDYQCLFTTTFTTATHVPQPFIDMISLWAAVRTLRTRIDYILIYTRTEHQ